MTLATQQILNLAPDPASAKAGSQLASNRYWSNVGKNDAALWGECQGSGKTPYRTQIDVAGPAFKCSCPSRKFPCKHGLGLYLLLAAEPALFSDENPPGWVSDWLQTRQAREEKKAEKIAGGPEPSEEEQATAAAQAQKREARREAKVGAGLDELQTWLDDLAREGLASVRAQGQGLWNTIAARMADAQAAPLTRRLLRAAGTLYRSGSHDAESQVASELAAIYLLAKAWGRIDALPVPLQADVRMLLGWTVAQDDVLREPAVADRWRVLAQATVDDDRVRTRETWLHGAATGRWALLLHHAVGAAGFQQQLAPGTEFDGELCFYPSAHPLRALVKTQSHPGQLQQLPPPSDLDGMLDSFAHALAAQPFLERLPVLLGGLVPDVAARHVVRDASGRRLDLHPSFRHWPHLLALSGGQPLAICGEWDGRSLLPLGIWSEGRLYNIDSDLPT